MSTPSRQLTYNVLESALVRALLPPVAATQYSRGAIGKDLLEPYAAALRGISAHYTQESQSTLADLAPLAGAAYALYFLPINFHKLLYLFRFLPPPLSCRPLRILDLGCGPGTAAWAAHSFFEHTPHITAFDVAPVMIDTARRIGEAISTTHPRLLRAVEFSSFWKPRINEQFDLIVAGNVVNESRDPKNLLAPYIGHLASQGCLLILEPGMKETTQRLMHLRDELLATSLGLSALFPCTHSLPCPMRRGSPNDWCHGTLTWNVPPIVRQLDEITGFNKHRIKFSALLMGKGFTPSGGYRALTDIDRSRRGDSALICGEQFFGRATLGRRNRSDVNEPFRQLRQYSHFTVETEEIDHEVAANCKIALTPWPRT